MARARNIKPGFFRNADLVELAFEDRLLFIGLWTLADRDGRLEDRPKQIKMELFPADSVDCNAMLDSLAATGMVARYEVDGKRYLQVVNFTKHQNPHRDEKASTIPDQCGNTAKSEPTPDKHRANTVQAPCKDDANTVSIGLNPDPLTPEPLTNTPIPPSGAEPEVIPAKPKTAAVAFPTWMESIKATGEKPIPEDDPVFTYAAQVGIPPEHLRLCWREFRHRYSLPGAKRYRDWRGVFRKAVRGNWLKLWWVDGDGAYSLTTVGKQAEKAES